MFLSLNAFVMTETEHIRFNSDGSMDFMVGLYASKRSSFSPLVEENVNSIPRLVDFIVALPLSNQASQDKT
jgi:hypothetical protein